MPQAKKQVFFSHSALFRRSSRRPSHPLPHRTATKRRSLDIRTVFLARVFPTVFLARVFLTVFPTRPRTAPRRKDICTLFAPFFSPAFFPPSFSPRPTPHRTAAKRHLHAFRTVFLACVFFTVLLTPLFSLFSEKVLTKGRKLAIIIRQTTKRRSAVLHGEVLKRSKRRPC